jgi:hypothetical protein
VLEENDVSEDNSELSSDIFLKTKKSENNKRWIQTL